MFLSMLRISVIKTQRVRHSWMIEGTSLKWSIMGVSKFFRETRKVALEWLENEM